MEELLYASMRVWHRVGEALRRAQPETAGRMFLSTWT